MTGQDRRMVVLHFPGLEEPLLNPFISILLAETGREVDIVAFTYRRALLSRYDIAHWHWPEYFGASRTRLGRVFFLGFVIAFALRLWVTRTPGVRTIHNLDPHAGPSWVERLSLRIIMRRETRRVYLTAPPELPQGAVVIPHCAYPVVREPRTGSSAAHLGFFGSVLSYKGVDRLIRVFSDEVGASSLRLGVRGRASDSDFADELEKLASDDDRVDLELRQLTDEELTVAIQSWDLVVLPYTKMYNSGAALLALSYARPILVPDTESMRQLQHDVGSDWVLTYQELTGDVIVAASDRARALAEARAEPDLSRRTPAVMGRQYLDLYRELAR